MSEQQIKEPVAPYTTAAIEIEEKAREQAREIVQIQFPPYFERFLEERDRRFSSDLAHLRVEIQRIREELGVLRADMDRRFAEAKEERESLRAEMDRRFAEAREERERGFAEAKEERKSLREDILRLEQRMDTHLRWILGLLFSVILGILAIIFRVFFGVP